MKNADPAVIEFITARSANYPVAGVGFEPTTSGL